jgi:hypothetical protein
MLGKRLRRIGEAKSLRASTSPIEALQISVSRFQSLIPPEVKNSEFFSSSDEPSDLTNVECLHESAAIAHFIVGGKEAVWK